MNGRFFLGVGTGENLNEHVVRRGWPSGDVRLEMLEEAIRRTEKAGYTQICMHQVGPEQERFIEFYAREVFPALGGGR